MPSSVPSKPDDDEDDYAPFFKKPIGTPVPKEDALLFGTNIKAVSEPGGLTDNTRFITIPARDLEYTNISKRRNSRGGESDNNGDRKQQFPGFPSQNSPSTDPTLLGCLKDQRKVTCFLIRGEMGGQRWGR